MEHSTLVGLSGDSVVDDGPVGPVGDSRAEQSVRALSGSARTQAQEHSPHPTHTKMPRQSHDREPPEHNRSTANAIHDRNDPKNGHDTGRLVANARRHPQITHAPATSCPVYYMCTAEVALMDMDRGTLARIDRRLLAGLGDDEVYRTLRVPATGSEVVDVEAVLRLCGRLDGPGRHDAYRSRARRRVR